MKKMSSEIANSVPKYSQLKDLIVDRIRNGKLAPGADIPTQRELMAQFNLSYSTVSRALQDLVRDGYITRVMGSGSVVAQTAAAKLRGPMRVHIIGGIPEAQRKGLLIFQELLEAGRELGLTFAPHEDETQAERAACIDTVLNAAKSGASEAFIFPYFAGNRDHIDRLKKLGVPYVVMDVPHKIDGYNIVLRDHRAGARVMIERFLAAGHKPENIGLLLGTTDLSDPDPFQWDQAKSDGVADALGPCDPSRTVWRVEPTAEGGERATRELLERLPRLTALFCDNADKAQGACRALSAAGRRIPQDVSVACVNTPRAGTSVALAHTWAPAEGVGRAAAEVLFALLTGKSTAPYVRELEMSFDDGASIAPPAKQ